MHIALHSLGKRFGPVQAVADASLDIAPGQVLALLGENGAGKSTLMKLLYGLYPPDAGRIEIDGRPCALHSPREAMAWGIGMVFQQFSLVPALSLRENLALVLPRAPWWLGHGAARVRHIDETLHTLLPGIPPTRPVAELSVGQMQLVELAKLLLLDARCVILDEPSAVLTPAEAQRLWQLMRGFADRGLAVVLITHKLNDVRACADRVAVMRAGRVVAQVEADRMDDAQIVEWMVGQRPAAPKAPAAPAAGAAARLRIEGLRAGAARGIDLVVHAGEIVGVAGVSGNGQTALAEAVAGVLPLEQGRVLLDGPGLGYIPEQPLRNAVAAELPLQTNLALKRIATLPFLVPQAQLQADARQLLERFDVRPADPRAQAQALSGGNLQKLVAARELSGAPAAVVACYPTMGLDVSACARLYGELFALARQGTAVLWISEDLDDLLQHSHRIAVMLDGRIVQWLETARTSVAEVGAWMAGAAAGGKACA